MNRENLLCQQFSYFTECNLATLEELKSLKSTSKCKLERQQSICDGMIAVCKEFHTTLKNSNHPGHNLPRLRDALREESEDKE